MKTGQALVKELVSARANYFEYERFLMVKYKKYDRELFDSLTTAERIKLSSLKLRVNSLISSLRILKV